MNKSLYTLKLWQISPFKDLFSISRGGDTGRRNSGNFQHTTSYKIAH